MTAKERVLAAINHKTSDRLPFDFWGTKECINTLIQKFQCKDYEDLLRYLSVDIRYIYGSGAIYEGGESLLEPTVKYIGPRLKTFKDGTFKDLWGAIRKFIRVRSGDIYREVIKPPLKEVTTVKQIEEYKGWPDPEWFDYSTIATECKKRRDHAIVFGGMPGMGTLFIQCWYMRGLDQILMDLVLNPKIAGAIVEKVAEFQIKYHTCIFEKASKWIDILQIGDDYGTEKGLMISPQLFRKFFAPYLKKLVDIAKKYNLKVMLHSDGNIRKLIPEFIDIGIDILNPIQWGGIPEMNPKELKKEFGKYICFHGAIDTQQFLPSATPNDVKKYVEDMIKVLGYNGGFIVSPTHTIELDVPIENVIALYKESSRRELKNLFNK